MILDHRKWTKTGVDICGLLGKNRESNCYWLMRLHLVIAKIDWRNYHHTPTKQRAWDLVFQMGLEHDTTDPRVKI